MSNSLFYLILYGFFCIFGLFGALQLAHRHYFYRDSPSACSRVLRSPYAFIGSIPVSYLAVLFYLWILGQLVRSLENVSLSISTLSYANGFMAGITLIYAYFLFFKLRTLCMGCIRIYIANSCMIICWILSTVS